MGTIIKSSANSELWIKNGKVANTFWSRFIGLQFKKSFGKMDGLIIIPCRQIHCFFMKMHIDVIFMDTNNYVVATEKDKKPWSISRYYKKAHYVIEMPKGSINRLGIKINEKVEIF